MYRYIWCLYRYITLQIGQTLSHVSIHARMLRYMLQKTDLYRYKHEFVSIHTRKNSFMYQFFIHSFIKHKRFPFLHEQNFKNPQSQFSISLKTQPKLTKLDPKPLQIHYPFTFLHQFHGSSFIISTFKNKGFFILGLWILQTFNKVTLL